MREIASTFNVKVGYSDHTAGIAISIGAVALGAAVIEKHFTLDKSMKGPDHKASVDPEELSMLVKSIRLVEKSLGDGHKTVTRSEHENQLLIRKSIVANCVIKKGEKFSESNLTTKRPAGGIPATEWQNLIGTYATRDYIKDELIVANL